MVLIRERATPTQSDESWVTLSWQDRHKVNLPRRSREVAPHIGLQAARKEPVSNETYPPHVQAMIDRAGTLTADETERLGQLWETNEDLVLPRPSIAAEPFGYLDVPVVTNAALLGGWQRALDAAGNAGRVDEIDAARAAGRAVVRDVRHLHDSESSKNGAEEAVRAAVLAVGVRDLISADDYETLVTPWQQVLGAI
jgi:hypothetical protein